MRNDNECELIIITDPSLINYELFNLKIKLEINILEKNLNFLNYKNGCINIIPIKLKFKSIPGILDKRNSSFVIKSIKTAVDLIQDNKADALVTNPINKFILKSKNFKFNGHTEYLGYLSKIKKTPIMLLESEKLKVVPLTTHIPLNQVRNFLNTEMIINKLKVLNTDLMNLYNIEKPKIFISGLNPHSGDNGTIGNEEIKIINPALKKLKDIGIDINGPIPGDTLFQKKVIDKYDVAVCMYHDQALIPIKTLYSGDIINTTLGLDFIRTSPDHGTALDIAGKKVANPSSLMLAIKKAKYLLSNRNDF